MKLKKYFEIESLTGKKNSKLEKIKIFANSHYVTPKPTLNQAIKNIKEELKERLKELYNENKLLEAQRLNKGLILI